MASTFVVHVPHVQLVDVPPCAGRTKAISAVVLEADLLAGIEVEIADLERNARAGAALGVVQGVMSGDQAAVDRVPQVRQVKAAERPMPVRTVALAPIELLAGDLQVIRVAGRVRLDRRQPLARPSASGRTSRRIRDTSP